MSGQTKVELESLDVVTIKMISFKDELPIDWESFSAAPIKHLVSQFPICVGVKHKGANAITGITPTTSPSGIRSWTCGGDNSSEMGSSQCLLRKLISFQFASESRGC